MNIRRIVTDIKAGKRMTEEQTQMFRDDKPGNDGQEDNILNVYDQVRYQKIFGFGGAFTQTSAVNFRDLTVEQKNQVLDLYFDKKKGIGYNFCRATINSCDFSERFYSYDDVVDDFELEHFDIAPDKEAVIPMIKEAQKLAKDIKLFASPWSPPAWMKTNGKMDKGGSLKKDCRDAWARYTAKYVQAIEELGIPIWGVTVQNEAKAEQGWESCTYEAGEERDFVTGYLKPTYEKAGLGDKKIMFWDHNKERAVDRSLETLCNARARDAFDGIAVHWYSGDHFTALDIVHDLFPEKFIVGSEQCVAKNPDIPWASGETYAHDIIGDLNHWASAWVDWNLILDEAGGPNHWLDELRENGAPESEIWNGESPILFDRKTKTLVITSSYYYTGQFSKYIARGARRIGYSVYTDELETCSFLNPNGEIVTVVLNRTDKDLPFTLRYHGKLADYSVAAHSICTLIFESEAE